MLLLFLPIIGAVLIYTGVFFFSQFIAPLLHL